MSQNGQLGSAHLKLGVMGGTFDPIHIGHLRVAEEMREALGLDRVLFVPAGNPVFKRDQEVTDAEARFAEVSAAVADNPLFEASRIEIDRPGDTFTVDTLRELHELHPEAELYFIVGSDAAADIGKWRAVAEIAQLAHLAVAAGRPGSLSADELRERILAAAPFDLHIVECTPLDISSSDIRRRQREGKSVRYLVPNETQCLASCLIENETGSQALRLIPGDESALTEEFFEARKAELERRVKPKRFAHSLGVAEACARLAEEYGLDVRKARLAGLLHDWDKGLDDDQVRARLKELGMEGEVDPFVVEHMPVVLHGNTAARALAREFPEIPGDVLQAIDRHTTAAEEMSELDMALYIADAIEPNRQFGCIDELRAAVGTCSLEELYFKTYEYWVFLLFERRKPLHPDTIRIWNSYLTKHPRKKEKRKK